MIWRTACKSETWNSCSSDFCHRRNLLHSCTFCRSIANSWIQERKNSVVVSHHDWIFFTGDSGTILKSSYSFLLTLFTNTFWYFYIFFWYFLDTFLYSFSPSPPLVVSVGQFWNPVIHSEGDPWYQLAAPADFWIFHPPPPQTDTDPTSTIDLFTNIFLTQFPFRMTNS